MEWREAGEVRWLEAKMPGATAAFTTRRGGVSKAPFASLNLGIFTDDRRDAVVENRRLLANALGLEPARIAIGHQVHGAELAEHVNLQEPSPFASPGSPIPKVDGHLTRAEDLALLVLVADCVPVALTGPGGVAMLHCGWRGLASSPQTDSRPAGDAPVGLIERAAVATEATHAAIGPSIGPCCYEVGEEVLAAFGGLGEGAARDRMLDLPKIASRLLQRAGVDRVEVSGLCTSCEAELFFSHRRDDGCTGRQAGLVWKSEGDG